MTSLSFDDLHPSAGGYHALLRGAGAAADLLAYPLRSEAGLLDAARAASARQLDRPLLAATLRAAVAPRGAPPAVLASLDELARPGSVVVVTGQQPTLFGGPHLILSKALAVLNLARFVAERVGVPVAPVFWNATEDHDHGEVDHVVLPDRDGAGERLRVALPGDRTALEATALPADFGAAVGKLASRLPEGPGRNDVLDAVRDMETETWGTAHSRLLLRLLGPLGLVVIEPRDVRPLALPVLGAEFRRPGDAARRVAAAEAALVADGHAPVLGELRPQLFFGLERGVRTRVTFRDGAFVWPDGRRTTPEEMVSHLRADPQAFSWNVVTRVVAQNLALPVAAQVCGPSELQYVALTRPVHAALDVPFPALVPRPGVTVVDPPVERAARAAGHDILDLVRAGAEAWPPVAAGDRPELAALLAALDGLPEESDTGVRRRRQALEKAVDGYAEALRRAAAERAGTDEARRRRVLDAVLPAGGLQERRVSWLGWYAAHSRGLLDTWAAAIDGLDRGHAVLRTSDLRGDAPIGASDG